MTAGRRSSAGVAEYIGGLRLFAGLSQYARRTLAQAAWFRKIDAGEILFFQSDSSEHTYVVKSGRLSLLISNPDGRLLVLEDARPGELFGELGALTGKPRTASALARQDSELLTIPAAVFCKLIDAEPVLARRVLDVTANRLQMSAQRQQALAFMNAQARLARYMLALEEQENGKGYITASQEDLAHGTGLIRQTVAKVLGVWRRDGWLETGRGRIQILDRRALERVEQDSTG